MRHDDQRIYRTFEEFEREELRRRDTTRASSDDMLRSVFGESMPEEPAHSPLADREPACITSRHGE
jgi:hypothetical protein